MLVAMAITAALCIGLGVMPGLLYAILPFAVDYHPYSLDHVVTQLQLLLFSALAFTVLMRTGLYPPELKSVNLDFDWAYRRLGKSALLALASIVETIGSGSARAITRTVSAFLSRLYRHHGPQGVLARTWPTGSMAFWATFLLAAYLIVYYL